LTELACTRTSTSLAPGVGSGTSVSTMGGVSKLVRRALSLVVSFVSDQSSVDDQLAGGAHDAERAPKHA
jgi:hypothetical protein